MSRIYPSDPAQRDAMEPAPYDGTHYTINPARDGVWKSEGDNKMTDDLVRRLRADYCPAGCSPTACVCGIMLDAADRIEALEAQLAEARADAQGLRDAITAVQTVPNLAHVGDYVDAILALIDQPAARQPTPEAVARAALECAAEIARRQQWDDEPAYLNDDGTSAIDAYEALRTAASDPATLAAIIAKAQGEGE
jgi:hypothetical protein